MVNDTFFLSHRGPEATHTRARAKFGFGPNKKSRGSLAGGATLTANYSRPNEAQHSRQIALGWAARDRPRGRYRGKRRLPARPSLTLTPVVARRAAATRATK